MQHKIRGLCVLLTLAMPALAEIYSWQDAAGQVHFGDQPPAGQTKKVVQPRANTIETAKLTPVKTAAAGIVMYSAEWCGVCKRAKRYFAAHGVSYADDIDIDASAANRQHFEALGGRGVPLILVGAERMDGFDPQLFEAMRRQP